MMHSDKLWEECRNALQDYDENINHETIYQRIVSATGEGVILNTAKHERKIQELYLRDKKDKHVLYLASIKKSRYLVTYNLKDFQQEEISHDANKRLKFHPSFEVVSPDRFFCMLIHKNPKKFLGAVARTIVSMQRNTVTKTLHNLAVKDGCPEAAAMLDPYTEEIGALVAQRRKTS